MLKKKTTKSKQEIVATALQEIHGKKGIITPVEVVAYATPEDSPLHGFFEWNNDKAAHEYRLWQARHLITSVRVTIENRQFDGYYNVHVKVDDKLVQTYASAKRVASDRELQQQVLATALKELEYWENKYSEVAELGELFKVMHPVIKKLSKQKAGFFSVDL